MKNDRSFKKQNLGFRGFTLIELLVVIAIIALLLSILIPALGKSKDLVKDSICMSNLRQISIAMRTYAQENKEFYPANAGALLWCLAYAPYVGEGDVRTPDALRKMGGIKIYNCPKYPDKTQLIDYVTNDWDADLVSPHNGTGIAKITDFKLPGTKVYMTDYETHGGFTAANVRSNGATRFSADPVLAATEWQSGRLAALDLIRPTDLPNYSIGNPTVQLPEVPSEIGEPGYSKRWNDPQGWDAGRRVALNRHKKWGTMVSYHDGHAGWLSWKDHKAELYNRK